MKANYRMLSQKQAIEVARQEYEKMFEKHQEAIQKDIVVQFMATILYTLDKTYGWRAKRLREFLENVKSTFEVMEVKFKK